MDVLIDWFFFAVPPDPGRGGLVTTFGETFWLDREWHMGVGLGVVPATLKPYFGPIPDTPLSPLELPASFQVTGLDHKTYVEGGYPVGQCCCLPSLWYDAGQSPRPADGDRLEVVPDRSGGGRDWIAFPSKGVTWNKATVNGLPSYRFDDGVITAGLITPALNLDAAAVFAVVSFPAGFPLAGMAIGRDAPPVQSLPSLRRGLETYTDGVNTLTVPQDHRAGERHLYALLRGAGLARLMVDGAEVGRAALPDPAPPLTFLDWHVSRLTVPRDPSAACDVPELVVLGCPTSDSEVSMWTSHLIAKYDLPDGRIDVPVVGSLLLFAGGTPPPGYLVCDGSAVSRTAHAALLAAIGTVWGAGNGSTTFNLPDFRGRLPRGVGTGPGLSPVLLGPGAGAESHALVVGELPAHNHAVNDPGHVHPLNDPGHFHTDGAGVGGFAFLDTGSGIDVAAAGADINLDRGDTAAAGTGATIAPAFTAITSGNTGGGGAFDLRNPWAGVLVLIYAGV